MPVSDERSSQKNKTVRISLPDTNGTSSNNMDVDSDDEGVQKAYIPGRSRPLLDDEELVMDKSSYRLFFQLEVESASLSFDVLTDNLGDGREVELNGSPISACIISGTQAVQGVNNNLVVMRLSNMLPFKRKVVDSTEDKENSASDSDESSSEDEEDLDSKPELDSATIRHQGAVNRIRACQHGGRHLAASWSELGKVHIWDLTRPLTAVNDSAVMAEYTRRNENPSPLYTFKGHRDEGFALDWSPNANYSGHLVTGDCNGRIHHWIPQPTGWSVGRSAYTGHTASVEDLQWSYTEPTVFISVSSDRSIRVWDVRTPPKAGSMITVPDAHPSDINVASWNRLQTMNLLTGGDEGSLRVWDLRLVHQQYGSGDDTSCTLPSYTQLYNYHSKPITSVEWHPTDAGVFVATSEDDQVTLWDTTLEQADHDETTETTDEDTAGLPVQLLFIHSGQSEVKEAHWHPQLPGLLIVTALDGFNVFRTCNV